MTTKHNKTDITYSDIEKAVELINKYYPELLIVKSPYKIIGDD